MARMIGPRKIRSYGEQLKVAKPSPLSLVRYKAKMKKLLFTLFIIIALSIPALAVEEAVVGYAAFFYLHDPSEEPDAYDDFSYYLNSVTPWLKEKNIIVSYYAKTPFALSLASGQEISFPSEDLELDLGVVFVRPDGQFKATYGVQTDVDIMTVVNDFFYKQALSPSTQAYLVIH